MSEPDLSTLPQRMRYAAEVLSEADQRYGKLRMEDECFGWDAQSLHAVAQDWQDEDRRRGAMVNELAADLTLAAGPTIMVNIPFYIASKLVKMGWRKGDPA